MFLLFSPPLAGTFNITFLKVVFLSVAIVLFLFKYTYLGSREAELWGAKVFHSLIHSPNAHNWQGWDTPKPRARSSSWVSPVHGSRIFSVSLIRQLDWRERWDLVTDSLVWDVPRGSLMCRTTTSAPMVHSFWQLCNIPSYLIYTPQFVHSVGEHWTCCHVFAIANSNVINIPIHNILLHMCKSYS